METQHILLAFEKTVEDLADDFRGKSAFSFATEADVQAALFGRLRANGEFYRKVESEKVHLVHAEFAAYGTSWKGAPRHDLVVWHPDLAKDARDCWGINPRHWPDQLQRRLNLVALEIERFAGLTWSIRQYQLFSTSAQTVVDNILAGHSDVRKLIESNCEHAYFILFWDDDIRRKDDLKVCFDYMRNAAKNLVIKVPRLQVWCISRDGRRFRARNDRI